MDMVNNCKVVVPLIRCASKNQDLSITEQLDFGIRFFDLDTIYRLFLIFGNSGFIKFLIPHIKFVGKIINRGKNIEWEREERKGLGKPIILPSLLL